MPESMLLRQLQEEFGKNEQAAAEQNRLYNEALGELRKLKGIEAQRDDALREAHAAKTAAAASDRLARENIKVAEQAVGEVDGLKAQIADLQNQVKELEQEATVSSQTQAQLVAQLDDRDAKLAEAHEIIEGITRGEQERNEELAKYRNLAAALKDFTG